MNSISPGHSSSWRCFAGAVLVVLSLCAGAQSPGGLPPQPDYKGEIRRGPDGKLFADPEPRIIETAPLVEAAPPAMPRVAPVVTAPAASAPPQVKVPSKPMTLVVGRGERIATLTEAARQARDGDTIEIKPGEYRGQPAVWTQHDLTIRGVGKRPVMVADNALAEDKGIWVVRGERIKIENVEFRGARASDMNGAGIRFDKGSLSVLRCAFFDNEMGILTANNAEMSLAVIDSEFGDSARTSNDFHHQLYVGRIGRLVLRGSRFTNGFYGHLVKSRARESQILYNMIVDGPQGHASYEIDLPNGGVVYLVGNVIGQGPESENPAIIAYGSEGLAWNQNAVYLAHNTLINDAPRANFLAIRSNRGPEAVEVWAINNLLVGNGDFNRPAKGRFEGNQTVARNVLIEQGGVPSRLPPQSPLRGSVRVPGQAGNFDLMPSAEFVYPAGTKAITASARLSPGAFQ